MATAAVLVTIGWTWHEMERGFDRVIGYAMALLILPSLALLTWDRIERYRVASEPKRKLAKLRSDLPLVVSGLSLGLAAVVHSFDMEWASSTSVMQRMRPALVSLHQSLAGADCAIPRVTWNRCDAARRALLELREQLMERNPERARQLLRKVEILAELSTYGRTDASRDAARVAIHQAVETLEDLLPPSPLLIKVGQQQILLVAILFFVLATPTRFALSYVEWREAQAKHAKGD